ncbi:hypothetical protein EVAR_18109_1 [Eumeta japonica]|uniref:Uncharacterized protein n=1 Tax=Eumeta variegata TaxID=151549 RepID=A0A4C1VI16_EUMVA|nr:hypothetical protein EVAR_18109_1 [Eumeta japonica]
MELKSPKAKKKNAKIWSKMLRPSVLVLFLMTAINCEGRASDHVDRQGRGVATKWRHHAHRNFKMNASDADGVVLSDVKYLREHINGEIVNFVMTDTLFDGEEEIRVHYGGVTAKETSVGRDGSGLKLRQLTDGRHLVQVIYGPGGDIQDCEFVTQAKSARRFLKTIRTDLKQALDEENFRIFEKHSRNSITTDSQDEFHRRFANTTFKIIKDGDSLPYTIASWLNYEKLKSDCLKTHERIKYMIDHRDETADQSIASGGAASDVAMGADPLQTNFVNLKRFSRYDYDVKITWRAAASVDVIMTSKSYRLNRFQFTELICCTPSGRGESDRV